MIESKDNEKLKLVRKLRERKHREREGLFATEGEDLLAAGLAAGVEPRFVLIAAGGGRPGGDRVATEGSFKLRQGSLVRVAPPGGPGP